MGFTKRMFHEEINAHLDEVDGGVNYESWAWEWDGGSPSPQACPVCGESDSDFFTARCQAALAAEEEK